MPEQQHTSDRPFCQTAIPCGRSRGIFIRILSIDRPLYLSLNCYIRVQCGIVPAKLIFMNHSVICQLTGGKVIHAQKELCTIDRKEFK